MIINNKSELTLQNLEDFYKSIFVNEVRQIAKGEGIKIAILDSGVDYFHPELLNRVSKTYDAFRNREGSAIDQVGHGTMIAGLIAGRLNGLVPNAELLIAKVSDDYGNLSNESIANGLMWSMNNGADIICMAFAGPDMNVHVGELLCEAEKRGIICVASSGNIPDRVGYPAKHGSVIAVGSINYSMEYAQHSGSGEEVDMVMPGIAIPSIYSYGRFVLSDGTSASTAIATGIIAMAQFLRKKEIGIYFNLRQLKNWISENTLDLGELGKDENFGYGVVSFDKAKGEGYKITF